MSVLSILGTIAANILPYAPSMAMAIKGGGSVADKALRALNAFFDGRARTPEELEFMLAQTDAAKLVELRKIDKEFAETIINAEYGLAEKQLDFESKAFEIREKKGTNSFFFTGPRYIAMWLSLIMIVILVSVKVIPFFIVFLTYITDIQLNYEMITFMQSLSDKIGLTDLIAPLGSLLGLAGFRSYEKIKDKERNGFN